MACIQHFSNAFSQTTVVVLKDSFPN